MESITMGDHHPSNSTEEADDLQDVVPQPGSGRLYECIFCKRGFTTAQALGGHMNIHRKDRAKGSRPNNPNYDHMSNRKLEEEDHSCYSNPNRFYDPIFASHSSNYISAAARIYDQEGLQVGFRTCFSSTSRSMRPINHYESNHEEDVVHEVITSPSSLRRQFGWSHEDQNQKRTINGGRNEEDELDLELRLGHDP